MISSALGAILVASSAQAEARAPSQGPPGMVLVTGGRTWIGTEDSELERMIASDAEARGYAGAISAETPRHEVDVPSFWLATTEVTNEQYAAYVRASGARPPEPWGAARIAQGRADHLAAEERRRKDAEMQGRPVPEADPFDPHAYWRAHWKDGGPEAPAFEIPPGDELRPVVFVDWSDASSFARWAGLRLPTEIEYQRAVRGDGTRAYPWGDAWEDGKYAATSLRESRSGASQVGSFPLGKSRQGVLDLAGNVWEWTSSPYVPFPGYQRRVIPVGFGSARHPVNAIADFDAEQRIVVGGSFQNGRLMARATTRRAAVRSQATDALGFRCAASPHPGFDEANVILDTELTANVRARDAHGMVEFAPEATVCVDGWATIEPGTAVPYADSSSKPPPGYQVIAGYRRVLFTPVRVVGANDPGALEKLGAAEGLVALGFLSTNVAVLDPDLPVGTYQVLWRMKGSRSAATRGTAGSSGGSVEAPLEEVLSIDPSLDHLVFIDRNGRPALAHPCRLSWENMRASRAFWIDPEAAPQTGGGRAPEGSRVLRFELCVPSRSGQKGFRFEIQLRLAPDDLGVSWRRG
jgi:formylglycine-generating enzyme required for sulfatase activity